MNNLCLEYCIDQPMPKDYPLRFYVHGGGFCMGSTKTYDALCRELALKSNSVVLSIDYRLSPEHRFPCGLEDYEDTLLWLNAHPNELNETNRGKLAVVGDSAGGNLTINLAVFAKNRGIGVSGCLKFLS